MTKIMKKMRLETTSPFQGLAELVADDEGLFAEEGIEIEWVKRANAPRKVDPKITTPDGLSAFASHGEAFEKGGAGGGEKGGEGDWQHSRIVPSLLGQQSPARLEHAGCNAQAAIARCRTRCRTPRRCYKMPLVITLNWRPSFTRTSHSK